MFVDRRDYLIISFKFGSGATALACEQLLTMLLVMRGSKNSPKINLMGLLLSAQQDMFVCLQWFEVIGSSVPILKHDWQTYTIRVLVNNCLHNTGQMVFRKVHIWLQWHKIADKLCLHLCIPLSLTQCRRYNCVSELYPVWGAKHPVYCQGLHNQIPRNTQITPRPDPSFTTNIMAAEVAGYQTNTP